MSPSDEIAVIRRAREIISDPVKWTQGSFARDKYGNTIEPISPYACRWCALGAIARAAKDLDVRPGDGAAAVDRLYDISDGMRTVVSINDNAGHAAILALFDKALATEAA
jgi:hypothetical protein